MALTHIEWYTKAGMLIDMTLDWLLAQIQAIYSDLDHICKVSTMFKPLCMGLLQITWSGFTSTLGDFDRKKTGSQD